MSTNCPISAPRCCRAWRGWACGKSRRADPSEGPGVSAAAAVVDRWWFAHHLSDYPCRDAQFGFAAAVGPERCGASDADEKRDAISRLVLGCRAGGGDGSREFLPPIP